jgi:hypothetical protein
VSHGRRRPHCGVLVLRVVREQLLQVDDAGVDEGQLLVVRFLLRVVLKSEDRRTDQVERTTLVR